ncbi:hypothetical protein [Cohnella sp. OV330]|uniref:hypothetical protein n=1 Tax=Cohnella sp. OV330 TaxID=1855288 RepID=UPI000B7E82FD|nr:hypothetical protein [Cohnella sp. OV330]
MTDDQLLVECKIGLDIPVMSSAFDGNLIQKIRTVKGYMRGAGVAQSLMADDRAVGIIVIGVTDLWQLNSGEIKFSPVFHMLITQLAASKEPDAP